MTGPFLLALIGWCSLCQSAPTNQNKPPVPYEVAEAYEIYSAVLPGQWPVTVAHAKKLLIRAETTTGGDGMCLKPEGESIAVVGPAIKDYMEVNQNTWLLGKTFQMDLPYEFIFAADLKGIFSQGVGGWKMLYDRYPDSGGWIELSAIGFNADKTVAIVYVAHHCGMLCGRGGLQVLEKKMASGKH